MVGMRNLPQGKLYSCLLVTADSNEKGQIKWAFNRAALNDEQVKKSFRDGVKWTNIDLQGANIVGRTGSLERFNGAKKPYVIISEIVDNFGTTLGYKIADENCNVKNIPIRELLAYGARIAEINKGIKARNPKEIDVVPVQNAMYVPGDKQSGKRPFYRSYPKGEFIKEVYFRTPNKHVDNRKVENKDVAENEKTLNKLEQLYTFDQIKQLKLGKRSGVNIKIYANPQLSPSQMRALRQGLESGVDVRRYAFPDYDFTCMLYYNDCLENGIDIRQFISPKYSLGQLSELSLAIQNGVDTSKMSDPNLTVTQMVNIRERLEFETWSEVDVTKCNDWEEWVKAGKENVSW